MMLDKFVLCGSIVALILVAACSGKDGEDDLTRLTDEPVEAPSERALALHSEEGCVIDDDCSAGLFCFQNTCARLCESDGECEAGSCSPRGRCTGADDADILIQNTLPGLEVVAFPDTIRTINSREDTVTFDFGLSGTIPHEGIPYRVRRNDDLGDPSRIRHITGTDTFSVTVETGLARPSSNHEARPVSLTIFSAIGDFDILLQPQPLFEGIWTGELSLDSFGGGQGFEISPRIIGNEIDDLSMVLTVSSSSLFSPRDNHDPERDYEMAPLVYRANTNTYQALFTYEYRFDEGLFGNLRARQVERSLRFDFDADALAAGRLEGRFADQWRGLHDGQRTSGAREVGTIDFIGSFFFDRADDLDRSASSFTVSSAQPPQPALIDRGTLGSCESSDFALEAFEVGDETYTCGDITTVNQFLQTTTSVEAQASCALALATSVSLGETTAKQIARYFAEEAGPQGLSFEAFLQSCADESDEVCSPSPRASCAYDLAASTAELIHRGNLDETARVNFLLAQLMVSLADMSQEAFLARQLGAFYTDMELRRQWLRASAAPAVFLAAVEAANEALMEDWRHQVLDVHHGVFMSFFTQDAITFLGRTVEGELANERRRETLAEAGVLWRGYSEALQLAAARWNESVRDAGTRTRHVEFLQSRSLELYLSLGLLNDFNRAAGASFQSAGLAGNFAALTKRIDQLATPFQDAIFARDAEVVTARSLNPMSDNDSLLSERRTRARTVLATAKAAIEDILNDVTIEAIAEQDFRQRMADQRNKSANRIAELCGLPPNCSESDLYTNDACLNVEPGGCGLLDAGRPEIGVTFDPSKVAASEGGRNILSILEAFENVAIQNNELDTHIAKSSLQLAELEAFRADVESWNNLRLQGIQQLKTNLGMRDQIRDQNIKTMLDNFATRASSREEGIASMQASIAESHSLRVAGANASY
ncbi:MAG: dickkopf-related protein, partial [Bradymonadaceae bacterium]